MAVTSMPQLDTLRLKPTYPKVGRYSPDTSVIDFLYHYEDTIASLYTYQAPPSCTRLPVLLVSSQEFLGCQSLVHDGRLMYMASPNNIPLDPDVEIDPELA